MTLSGAARAAVCGDGVFDPGEACDPGLAATSAYSRCCNATCDGLLDADGDNLCDHEDVCTRSDSTRLTETTLRMDRIGPPAGNERMRFTGRLRFPPSSFVDPAVAGLRFGLHGETYYHFLVASLTPMIAAHIPGGDGWTTGTARGGFGIRADRSSCGRTELASCGVRTAYATKYACRPPSAARAKRGSSTTRD